jgi:hypothetical protein
LKISRLKAKMHNLFLRERFYMNLDNLLCIDWICHPWRVSESSSALVVQGDGFTLLVDLGHSPHPKLCASLRSEGWSASTTSCLPTSISTMRWDRALLKEFPEATVICHPEGIRHMVSPQKLWKGHVQCWGPGRAYGEIVAVPTEKIRMRSMLVIRGKGISDTWTRPAPLLLHAG